MSRFNNIPVIKINQTNHMNIDQNNYSETQPAKCTACKNFYASEAYKGLCSSCYKKSALIKETQKTPAVRKQSVQTQPEIVSKVEIKSQPKKQQEKPAKQGQKQIDRKRCYNCKKKVGLLGVECKCGFVYCNSHRLPEEHSCSFNHQKVANDRLKETLFKVCNGKIADI